MSDNAFRIVVVVLLALLLMGVITDVALQVRSNLYLRDSMPYHMDGSYFGRGGGVPFHHFQQDYPGSESNFQPGQDQGLVPQLDLQAL